MSMIVPVQRHKVDASKLIMQIVYTK